VAALGARFNSLLGGSAIRPFQDAHYFLAVLNSPPFLAAAVSFSTLLWTLPVSPYLPQLFLELFFYLLENTRLDFYDYIELPVAYFASLVVDSTPSDGVRDVCGVAVRGASRR
jgi:hypothetical protein